jgi:putative FmdB family regulatory protein
LKALRSSLDAALSRLPPMPIYAYKCAACGHARDVLQKISDDPLTVCPVCGAQAFRKQLTAAGFQLKGSGWYATDFKGGASAPPAGEEKAGGDKAAGDKAAGDKPAGAKPAEPAGDSKSTPVPAPAAAPASTAPPSSGPPAAP